MISKEKDSKTNLPLFLSWKTFIPDVVDQGECGNCYAISTSRMLTARMKILVNIYFFIFCLI